MSMIPASQWVSSNAKGGRHRGGFGEQVAIASSIPDTTADTTATTGDVQGQDASGSWLSGLASMVGLAGGRRTRKHRSKSRKHRSLGRKHRSKSRRRK
jgi:hypothetical protein